MTKATHTPGPWHADFHGHIIGNNGSSIAYTWTTPDVNYPEGRPYRANARLIAAATELLAYAECSAAVDCSRVDPQYDPQPVLRHHGWNGKENPDIFLSRIRRDALSKAVGHYLGRAAA